MSDKDFLQRLYAHEVRPDQLVDHMINGNSHMEIIQYLSEFQTDPRYVNEVLEEARNRHAGFLISKGPLSRFYSS